MSKAYEQKGAGKGNVDLYACNLLGNRDEVSSREEAKVLRDQEDQDIAEKDDADDETFKKEEGGKKEQIMKNERKEKAEKDDNENPDEIEMEVKEKTQKIKKDVLEHKEHAGQKVIWEGVVGNWAPGQGRVYLKALRDQELNINAE